MERAAWLFPDPRQPTSCTWASRCSFLRALFALPMTDAAELAMFQACTGRAKVPTAPASEAWLVCGRRAGKSFVLALVAVFLACFRDYRAHLAPGERAMMLIIATDRRQARVILRYLRALLTKVPMLAKLIERETADSFDLSNGVSIEVGTASFRSIRGYTLCAALCDEIAYWPSDDAAEPDYGFNLKRRGDRINAPTTKIVTPATMSRMFSGSSNQLARKGKRDSGM
jgi:hypothetical protein